jgi:CheY-like chemotaxis protein
MFRYLHTLESSSGMEYVPLGFMGLLALAYLFLSFAECLLWLTECVSSAIRGLKRIQMSGQENRGLPSLVAVSAAPDAQTVSHRVPAQKPGILIAAEHGRYRRVLETWFRDHSFTAWVAADGHQALELHRVHAKNIALALLDVFMPRLDGPGTLTALQRETPSLPCCFMIANLTTGKKAQLLALGAAEVFEKPLLLRETTAIIWSLIQNSKQPQEEQC